VGIPNLFKDKLYPSISALFEHFCCRALCNKYFNVFLIIPNLPIASYLLDRIFLSSDIFSWAFSPGLYYSLSTCWMLENL